MTGLNVEAKESEGETREGTASSSVRYTDAPRGSLVENLLLYRYPRAAVFYLLGMSPLS